MVSSEGVSVSVKSSDTVVSNLFKKADPSKITTTTSAPSGGGASVGSASSQTTKTIQQGTNVAPVTTSSSQSLTAVRDIVNTNVNLRVDQVARPATTVVTGGIGVSVGKSEQSQAAKVDTPKQATEQKQSTETTQKPSFSTVNVSKTFTSTETLSQEKVDLSSVSGMKSSSRSRSALVTKTFTDSTVKEKVATEATVISLTAQKSQTLARTRVTPMLSPNLLRGALIIPRAASSTTTQVTKQGFGVFVRERGVFKQVGAGSFGLRDAKDYGAYVVSNTPRATFTLRPSALPVRSAPSKARGFFGRTIMNFKRKGDLFIEKREKRISTAGELEGITRKGILASKNKRMFERMKL